MEIGRYFDVFVRSPDLNRAVILEHFHNLGNLPVSNLVIDSVTQIVQSYEQSFFQQSCTNFPVGTIY